MDKADFAFARKNRREVMNKKHKKLTIRSITTGGESASDDLSPNSPSNETAGNQGTPDAAVTAFPFREKEHNENSSKLCVSLDASHKLHGEIVNSRKRVALSEIDMNSTVEASQPTAFAVTLVNHTPLGTGAKVSIGACRKRPALCEIDKNVEIRDSFYPVNDKIARRDIISKLFNSRHQSIPQIVLDRTLGCTTSLFALGNPINSVLEKFNNSIGHESSDGSVEISDVTLAELKSRTKGINIKVPTNGNVNRNDNKVLPVPNKNTKQSQGIVEFAVQISSARGGRGFQNFFASRKQIQPPNKTASSYISEPEIQDSQKDSLSQLGETKGPTIDARRAV
ncbi:hypothetical protein PIB30_046593 [Stylosanthes scabra]|uniref:Uncharacterized protein n=1 Tax=Stylosanthes scabra TaxID=79078 RepID=A0ABU6QI15_9FABA|nr:hypothetical protein [Stylosanthes scabra]